MNTDLHFSSASDNWETPQWLFDELHREFNFQLDVCASEHNKKCVVYFNKEDNGLVQKWHEHAKTAWMNPPYGREIGKWVRKAKMESLAGVTVVCLLPARTDTRWFHDYIWDKEKSMPQDNVSVRFLQGRLKFGGASNSAPFPSMIIVFRPPNNRD